MNQKFNKLEAHSIWSSAVKSAKRLAGRLVIVAPLLAGSRSLGWVKATFVFVRTVFVIVKEQGCRGAAIRLKSEKLLLEKWLAGDHVAVPQDLGPAIARTRLGIPRTIPGHHRKRIKSGDKGAIRLWLGLFTLYRVLPYKGKYSVKTIVTPGVVLKPGLVKEWKSFVWVFTNELNLIFNVTPLAVGKTPKGSSFFPQLKAVMVPLLKSGPNTAWAWTAGDPDNCLIAVGSSLISLFGGFKRRHGVKSLSCANLQDRNILLRMMRPLWCTIWRLAGSGISSGQPDLPGKVVMVWYVER